MSKSLDNMGKDMCRGLDNMGRAFEEALGPNAQPDGHSYRRPAGYEPGASSFAHAYPFRDADWADEPMRGAAYGGASSAGVPA